MANRRGFIRFEFSGFAAETSSRFSEGEIGDGPVLVVEGVGQLVSMEKRAQVVLKKNQA